MTVGIAFETFEVCTVTLYLLITLFAGMNLVFRRFYEVTFMFLTVPFRVFCPLLDSTARDHSVTSLWAIGSTAGERDSSVERL